MPINNPLHRDKNAFLLVINDILDRLYTKELHLFTNNEGKWLTERCLVFRISFFLQRFFTKYKYYVDCDYNSSLELVYTHDGRYQWKNNPGKLITCKNSQWNLVMIKRFIDIIIHKRVNKRTDLICFEVKKRNNQDSKNMEKDTNNLKVLTSDYWYKFWFHLILWQTRKTCKIHTYAFWSEIIE